MRYADLDKFNDNAFSSKSTHFLQRYQEFLNELFSIYTYFHSMLNYIYGDEK